MDYFDDYNFDDLDDIGYDTPPLRYGSHYDEFDNFIYDCIFYDTLMFINALPDYYNGY